MKRVRFSLLLLALVIQSHDACGDGGIMRCRDAQGPFVVSIFTASEAVQGEPLDVSVLVQDRNSNDAILDATVNLILTPPFGSLADASEAICGGTHSEGTRVAAMRSQASNKLLYAAPVQFDASGVWQLQATIQSENDSAKITCSILVGPPPRKFAGVFPYLLLPPALTALFALHQRLRGRLSQSVS